MIAEQIAADIVRENLAAVLELDATEVEPEMSFHHELELDSLQKTEFLARLERAFGVLLAPDDVAGLDTVTGVLGLLRTQGRVG